MEGSESRAGSGFVQINYGSGRGSRRPENIPYGSYGSGTLLLRAIWEFGLPNSGTVVNAGKQSQ
jgi:hypothetical protein